jgi:uncharacterized protein (DUF58 family)
MGAGAPSLRQPLSGLQRQLRARMARWVHTRQGDDQLPVRLERRRLYILPTRGGVAFGTLLLVMLLAGLNYANSLALLLTFVLAAFVLVAMQQCHRNLLGISVIALEAPAVFAQRPGQLLVRLGNPEPGAHFALEAQLEDGAPVRIDLPPGAQGQLALSVPAQPRGVLRIERVRISTAHPYALFRAWTWVHAPLELIVYPGPRGRLPMPQHGAARGGARQRSGAGVDEWLGLRPFRDGDSPRQVDWKAYAREAPLLVKEYQAAGADLRIFDFAHVPLADPEARLAQLARWVVDAEAGGERYGLVLPGVTLPADRGPEHRHRCLTLMARLDAGGSAGGGR